MEIIVNGVRLYYEKRGEGEPLLLLHGNGEDHHLFDALATRLATQFTLYLPDSRNHGQSEKTDVYSYDSMAGDIAAFISALGISPVNITGFSDGAIVALLAALHTPALIKRLALLGVNLSPRDFTDESLAWVRNTWEETADPLFKLMLEQPDIPLEALTSVKQPALVVAAEDDIFKPEATKAVAQALPDARLLVMRGHDHSSYIENSGALAPELLAFFSH